MGFGVQGLGCRVLNWAKPSRDSCHKIDAYSSVRPNFAFKESVFGVYVQGGAGFRVFTRWALARP